MDPTTLKQARKKEPHKPKTQPFSVSIPERNGCRIIMDALVRNGVEVIFGLPGGTVIPLYDTMLDYRDTIRHVLVRHEQAAIHAADAYARVTGKPGVALTTSGPGATNLVTGLMNAYLDSVPMVVMSGQVPTSQIGTDGFQECDMPSVTQPITKYRYQPRSLQELENAMEQAFLIATSGRPGPVFIDIPKDIQVAGTQQSYPKIIKLPGLNRTKSIDMQDAVRANMLVRAATRPLLLLGHGVVLANAGKEWSGLAKKLQIPVVTTILSKGCFDEYDPLALGCIGMHGRRSANYAISQCDVLLAVGCRFSDRATGDFGSFSKGKKIIHVDIDHAEIGKNVDAQIGLNCDAGEAARVLSELLDDCPMGWDAWTSSVTHLRRICNRCVPQEHKKHLTPAEVMAVLNAQLEPDDIVATGVGQHQMFASHHLYRSKPRTFITSGGAGTMGFGLPAAIGASMAAPKNRVWLIDGDGSFQMNLQELSTMKQSGAKIAMLLMDNGYLGMVRQWQELFFKRRYSAVELTHNPDFSKIAEAYGIEAHSVDNVMDLSLAVEKARSSDKSILIRVVLDKESNILPMIPQGGGLTDFMGNCMSKPGCYFSSNEILRQPNPKSD